MDKLEKGRTGEIVSVGFSNDKALTPKWNTLGMLSPYFTTFKHVFIFQKHDFQNQLTIFREYYETMKAGDIFGIIRPEKNENGAYKVREFEKTPKSQDLE